MKPPGKWRCVGSSTLLSGGQPGITVQKTCKQKQQQATLAPLRGPPASSSRCLLRVKWDHYEHKQLPGNYHVTGLCGVIKGAELRSQLSSVNVMCGDLILKGGVIKLNDLHRTVAVVEFQWVEDESQRRGDDEKVSVWAEWNVSRFIKECLSWQSRLE